MMMMVVRIEKANENEMKNRRKSMPMQKFRIKVMIPVNSCRHFVKRSFQ